MLSKKKCLFYRNWKICFRGVVVPVLVIKTILLFLLKTVNCPYFLVEQDLRRVVDES